MEKLTIMLLLFVTYSFIGWLNEVILGIFQHKKIINRGFLIGPICPIYGFGTVFMTLTLTGFKDHPIVVFALAIMSCAILEYSTSYIMEKLFNNRWWDYSDMKYNINGRICLETMVPFGVGALIMMYIGNPIFIPIYEAIPINVRYIIILILLIIAIVDILISFNIIINLKNISNNIKSDSTEVISNKVKEILLTKNIIYKRLRSAFPDMQIKNTRAILKEKIDKQKEKIIKQKEKIMRKKEELINDNKILKELKKDKKKTTKK